MNPVLGQNSLDEVHIEFGLGYESRQIDASLFLPLESDIRGLLVEANTSKSIVQIGTLANNLKAASYMSRIWRLEIIEKKSDDTYRNPIKINYRIPPTRIREAVCAEEASSHPTPSESVNRFGPLKNRVIQEKN